MQMKRKDNKTQLKGPLQTYEDFNTPKQFFICRSEPTSPGRKYVISYICDCDDLDFQDNNIWHWIGAAETSQENTGVADGGWKGFLSWH